ncbi:PIR protein [Plasmodium vivax]|uniref:VIR protein n=1 Tax=Plasmodium vivax TaxID=5855 RepID=A0A564ZPP2_PLAVI|nr:PIR protein [Plasmodium vivax]
MTPGPKKMEELYAFFDNIDRYIINGKCIEDTINNDESFAECNSFSIHWGNEIGNTEMAKKMCNIFISIYKKLKNNNNNYTRDSDYNNDFAFLNYWVNWKIYDEFNENTSVSDFYDHIGSHVTIDSAHEFTNTLIYDIDNNDVYNMNILYNLYENYGKLNAIKYDKSNEAKQSLYSHSTACCTHYIKASYMCNNDNKNNNPIFCEKLNTFKSKHDALHTEVVQKDSEYSNHFVKLEECPNNKIITTAVTGTVVGLIPLFGVLYKFTPMGQMFRSKMGILNNNISNNEEDMTNMSLMEQENEPLRFKQGTYNIKYQSL